MTVAAFRTSTWEERARKALEEMAVIYELGVDTESTGVEYIKDGRHFLTGVSCAWMWGAEVHTFYFPFFHKRGENLPRYIFDKLVMILSHKTKTLYFDNLKFDMHSFMTAGYDMVPWECTLRDIRIDQHYLDENFPKGLDVKARIYLGEHKSDNLKGAAEAIGWENISSEAMEEYACQDARLTLLVALKIMNPRLNKTGLMNLIPEAIEYRKLLFQMEQEGVGANLEFCAEMEERGNKRMAELISEVGFDPAKRNQLKKFLLEDMGFPIVKLTDKGNPCFDKEALAEYDELLAITKNPAAKYVLEFRGWHKAVTSLYMPIQRLVSPDGRIRTNLNQTGTVTGRLSSNGPNLQQIPRSSAKPWNGRAKLAFNAGDSDYVLIGYDYSQLELRLGAWYGGDQALIDEFHKPDGDPFRAIAEGIFGEFNPDTRQSAKTFTYATNYGAGKAKVASQLGVSMEEVEGIYDRYHEAFPGLFSVAATAQARGKSRGYIRYWTGRRRNLKDKSKAFILFNSLLQGGAAELVKKAQLKAPNDEYCKQVLQVHDEIAWKIRKDKVEEYRPKIIEAMTDFPEIPVPLKVEGKAWADA